MNSFLSSVKRSSWYPFVRWQASCHVALGTPPTGSSELRLSSIGRRLLAFAPMVIVSRHGAQLAFVGIFCGFARARLERNHDLRNQQVAIRDTMLGAEPRNLLIGPHAKAVSRVSCAALRAIEH